MKTKANIYRPNDELGGYRCDWCGQAYPLGHWDYYQLLLFGSQLHTICDECFKHLKLIKAENQTGKQDPLDSVKSTFDNSKLKGDNEFKH